MRFGLFFFAASGRQAAAPYVTVLNLASWAEQVGFEFISIPERHYHEFGGPFPNPHILLAALSQRTETLQLRYGSLISPLHDSLELAENLAMLQHLSGRRVAVSFGSGWHPADFVLRPDRYANRRERMWDQVAEILATLETGSAAAVSDPGGGGPLEVYPVAPGPKLPVWITSSGSIETFERAGAAGYNLLTHMERSSLPTLAKNIEVYHEARQRAGHSAAGCVTVMLHTFVSEDSRDLDTAKGALRTYLAKALDLERRALRAGGRMSGARHLPVTELETPEMRDSILDAATQKYLHSAALIGSPDHCARVVQNLRDIGVAEIACLVDFADPWLLERGLEGLASLVNIYSDQALAQDREAAVRKLMANSSD